MKKQRYQSLGPCENIPWEGKYSSEWTNTFTLLGIRYNTKRMGKILDDNAELKRGDI